MTRNQEVVIPIRGLWGRIRDFFSVGVSLLGMHQQEKLDDAKYELDEHTWGYSKPGDPNRHTFRGTPERFREFRADNPEWFLESEWEDG